jgi:hypothetical protein
VKWGFYSSETRKSGFESGSIALPRFPESQTLRNVVICYGFLKIILLLVYCKKVLQDMIYELIENGRYYGMEMNVEKLKVIRISRQPSPVKIIID